MVDQTTTNGAPPEAKPKEAVPKKKKEPKPEAEIPPEVSLMGQYQHLEGPSTHSLFIDFEFITTHFSL